MFKFNLDLNLETNPMIKTEIEIVDGCFSDDDLATTGAISGVLE